MELMKMTAKEILNLIDWLRAEGYSDDKVAERIEAVEGKKSKRGLERRADLPPLFLSY